VKTDSKKLKVIVKWPKPTSLKALRGFLGLICYYRKFVRGYDNIVALLIQLLKKHSILWSEKAERAFEELKKAITNLPVLILLDFSHPFIIEYDASGREIGAILMQK
jgi:hypothetical protein